MKNAKRKQNKKGFLILEKTPNGGKIKEKEKIKIKIKKEIKIPLNNGGYCFFVRGTYFKFIGEVFYDNLQSYILFMEFVRLQFRFVLKYYSFLFFFLLFFWISLKDNFVQLLSEMKSLVHLLELALGLID